MQPSVHGVAWPSAGRAGEVAETVIPRDLERSCSEDLALARRMMAGEAVAFERFTRDYLPPLYRFALRRAHGDLELAREIVQATVCKAIARLDGYRGEALLTTWLCACCNNEMAAHYRRGGREVELDAEPATRLAQALVAPGDSAEDAALHRERAAKVHETLDALPPDYGRVLEWKYLEDLPVEEIARRLERHPKAAESLLTRAREAFRRRYLGAMSSTTERERS
jgi:RNA polymerase sigma-70 factor (ECF subfamily)